MQKDYLEQLDLDRIHLTTRPYLNKVLQHTEPYEVPVFEQTITVLPGVMSPAYDWAGHFMIDCLPVDLSGQDILELGTGCGLVSVFAGLRGAQNITSTDISPAAVKNTKINFKKHHLTNAFALESDVFQSIPKKTYDLIIFNLPYHDSKPTNDLEKGVMDLDYQAMQAFFKEAKSFLKPTGQLYVGFSRSGNLPRFMQEIKKQGFHIERMWEKNTWENDARFAGPDFHYNCQIYLLSHVAPPSHPATNLPLLDWVVEHTRDQYGYDGAIVVHVHLLPNNKPLLNQLATLSNKKRIYVLEKPYSTVHSVLHGLILSGFNVIRVPLEAHLPYSSALDQSLQILWKNVLADQTHFGFKQLLILDDGADVIASIPWEKLEGVQIAAVEQTQRGMTRLEGRERDIRRSPPVINVASSGIKKTVEASFIGTSVVKKLEETGTLLTAHQIGIIGMGSIGQAIREALEIKGISPLFHDSSRSRSIHPNKSTCLSLTDLFNRCDLLIGTTGSDTLREISFEELTGIKRLVSASSTDIEFYSLLKLASPAQDPFRRILIPVHEKLIIEILNGGYPMNFDRERDSTPDEDIVLTRCLMYIGAMQALRLLENNVSSSGVYHLDPFSQTKLLERWIEKKHSIGQEPTILQSDIEKIVRATPLKNGKSMPSIWRDKKTP